MRDFFKWPLLDEEEGGTPEGGAGATQTPPPADKNDAEVARLKRALADRQAEAETHKNALAELQAKIERDKLTEQEKAEADRKALEAKVQALTSAQEQASAALVRERQKLNLVAKANVADPEFAGLILSRYNPEKDGDDIVAFAATLKDDPVWANLFRRDAVSPISGTRAPARPASTPSSRQAAPVAVVITDEDKAEAAEIYPRDPIAQAAYLAQVEKTRKARAEAAA